jgi:hypothetical protein
MPSADLAQAFDDACDALNKSNWAVLATLCHDNVTLIKIHTPLDPPFCGKTAVVNFLTSKKATDPNAYFDYNKNQIHANSTTGIVTGVGVWHHVQTTPNPTTIAYRFHFTRDPNDPNGGWLMLYGYGEQ